MPIRIATDATDQVRSAACRLARTLGQITGGEFSIASTSEPGGIACCEPLALALSRKAHHPVKMAMTREDVFRATGPTSGSICRIKIGAHPTTAR